MFLGHAWQFQKLIAPTYLPKLYIQRVLCNLTVDVTGSCVEWENGKRLDKVVTRRPGQWSSPSNHFRRYKQCEGGPLQSVGVYMSLALICVLKINSLQNMVYILGPECPSCSGYHGSNCIQEPWRETQIVNDVALKVDRYKARGSSVCWIRCYGMGWCDFFLLTTV